MKERDTSIYVRESELYPPARGGHALHEDVELRGLDFMMERAEAGDRVAQFCLRSVFTSALLTRPIRPEGKTQPVRFRRYASIKVDPAPGPLSERDAPPPWSGGV